MTCDAYRNLIAAHVDDNLTLIEREEAEEHLINCKNCLRLFADQQQFRQITRTWRGEASVPAYVEHRLRVAIEAGHSPLQNWWQELRAQFASLLQPAHGGLAVAAVVLLLMAVFPKDQVRPPTKEVRTEAQTVLDAATAYYRAVRTGELPLAYATNNPRELEDALKASERLNFSLYVPDLRLAGYELNGGIVVNIDGKPTVITVYQGAEGQIVCLRQQGMMPPQIG